MGHRKKNMEKAWDGMQNSALKQVIPSEITVASDNTNTNVGDWASHNIAPNESLESRKSDYEGSRTVSGRPYRGTGYTMGTSGKNYRSHAEYDYYNPGHSLTYADGTLSSSALDAAGGYESKSKKWLDHWNDRADTRYAFNEKDEIKSTAKSTSKND